MYGVTIIIITIIVTGGWEVNPVNNIRVITVGCAREINGGAVNSCRSTGGITVGDTQYLSRCGISA